MDSPLLSGWMPKELLLSESLPARVSMTLARASETVIRRPRPLVRLNLKLSLRVRRYVSGRPRTANRRTVRSHSSWALRLAWLVHVALRPIRNVVGGLGPPQNAISSEATPWR